MSKEANCSWSKIQEPKDCQVEVLILRHNKKNWNYYYFSINCISLLHCTHLTISEFMLSKKIILEMLLSRIYSHSFGIRMPQLAMSTWFTVQNPRNEDPNNYFLNFQKVWQNFHFKQNPRNYEVTISVTKIRHIRISLSSNDGFYIYIYIYLNL